MQQVCPSEAAGSDLRGTREWCPCENLTPDDAAGAGRLLRAQVKLRSLTHRRAPPAVRPGS